MSFFSQVNDSVTPRLMQIRACTAQAQKLSLSSAGALSGSRECSLSTQCRTSAHVFPSIGRPGASLGRRSSLSALVQVVSICRAVQEASDSSVGPIRSRGGGGCQHFCSWCGPRSLRALPNPLLLRHLGAISSTLAAGGGGHCPGWLRRWPAGAAVN